MIQVNLYISNFNKRGNKVKKIISIICFILVNVCIYNGLNYILVDDTKSYTRITMHELYEAEENIDILFVGSSHCYCGLDPRITDEIFQCNTFNGGSSSQGLDGSLQIIKETDKANDIKHIYLEVYYEVAMLPEYDERTQMTQTYIISDYMKPSMQRLEYVLSASGKEHYSNSFLPFRRNWSKIMDLSYISTLVQKKLSLDYQNYDYSCVNSETETYMGKGYVETERMFIDDYIHLEENFEPIDYANISEDWKTSLDEIIKYCEENKIELTLFSAPMPDMRLTMVGNYDDYIMYINEVIQDTDIKYYDFNLCKYEYFSGEPRMFYDSHHLSKEGVSQFTTVAAELFTGKLSEEDIFYNSYVEKQQNLLEEIVGFSVKRCEEERNIYISPIELKKNVIEYIVAEESDLCGVVYSERIDNMLCLHYEDISKVDCNIQVIINGTDAGCINVSY